MKAKKSYGQHFLINQSLIENILLKLDHYSKGLPLLEVGPGTGALTRHLVKKKNFSAVEADQDMIDILHKEYPKTQDKIIKADFVKWPIAEHIHEQTALVGNFPYNISTQIVFQLLENVELFPVMVGMFQKEVADRIISKPNSKVYGILSVLAAHFYTGKHLIKVSPGSFSPPPKVQSSVIVLERNADWKERKAEYKDLRTVVKRGFNQRRKMLRSSLKSMGINEQLKALGLSEKRPEHLSLEEFRSIAAIYSASKESKSTSKSS